MIAARVPRRSRGIGPFRVDGDCVRHADGSVSAVVRAGELDVEALDAARRTAVTAAFARLCHTLDAPLQLVVRVRTLQPQARDASQAQGVRSDLDRAMRAYWAQRLRTVPAHSHEVFVATRASSPAALASAVRRVIETVHAMGIEARRLSDTALAVAISAGVDATTPLPWTARAQHVRVGSVCVRGFALRRLPGNPVSVGWLAPLLRVGVDSDIAIHLSPASTREALTTLGRKLRDLSAHRLIEHERGSLADVHVDIAVDSTVQLRNRLARNLGRPLHMSITAVARAGDPELLEQAAEAVRLAFQTMLARAEPAHFRHLAAFITTLPLGVDALGAVKLVESGAAALCVPWVEAGCADPGGYRIGETIRSRTPVRIAPFDATLHNNANIAILAASGHGKSFAMGAVMLEAATQDIDCIVVDPEGEYAGLVRALGGTYIALTPGGDVAVNVFDAAGGDGEDALGALVELVAVLCGGRLDDVERALVERAGREAQSLAALERRVPLLRDCLPRLEIDAPQVAVVVHRFCTGSLGRLFDRETSVHIDRGITGISLHETPAEHVAAATLILGRWLWRLVRHDPRRRHILFDEVGALCAHPPLRSLLVQLARRCRKYSASLVVATQNAQDLLGSDEGSVVATNSAVVLLGGHRAAETARMETAFGLTAAQRRFLEGAARGEFLLLAGERRAQMRVELPPEHVAMLRR